MLETVETTADLHLLDVIFLYSSVDKLVLGAQAKPAVYLSRFLNLYNFTQVTTAAKVKLSAQQRYSHIAVKDLDILLKLK